MTTTTTTEEITAVYNQHGISVTILHAPVPIIAVHDPRTGELGLFDVYEARVLGLQVTREAFKAARADDPKTTAVSVILLCCLGCAILYAAELLEPLLGADMLAQQLASLSEVDQ